MGSPDFAAVSLRMLIEEKYPILGVITQPDKPKGRGKKLTPTAVKNLALQYNLPIFQPISSKDPSFIQELQQLKPDVLIVIAFGQILSQALLDIAPLGAINIHGSLLPLYRGPAPIQWTLINGESTTGVTTIKMDSGVDTGDILLQAKIELKNDETTETLHNRLAKLGANLLLETLQKIENKSLVSTPQNDAQATYARMLSKKDGLIDWNKSAHELDYFVRGMAPWPRAFTFINGKRLLIHQATPVLIESTTLPGTVLKVSSNELIIATGQKEALSIQEVQQDSGKRLSIKEYLKGVSIQCGDFLGESA